MANDYYISEDDAYDPNDPQHPDYAERMYEMYECENERKKELGLEKPYIRCPCHGLAEDDSDSEDI